MNKKWNIAEHNRMSSNNMFRPVINIFDKAVVICFPKVGTRFFLYLSNWPKTINETYNQYQIDITYEIQKDKRLNINTEFNNYGTIIHFLDEHKTTCSDYNKFFEKNSKDMNTFLFENEKDIYFVIRDPFERFLSGLTQVASSYVKELIIKDDEKDRIKKYTDLTDEQIELIYKNYDFYFNDENEFNQNNLSEIDLSILNKIILYIIKYYPELYLYDAHTQNYLSHYTELIYSIKDKNKIKIIDLKDCKTKDSIKLFNKWGNNIDYKDSLKNTNGHIVSNKKLYNNLLTLINEDESINQTICYFLLNEIKEYNKLKTSKFFINF